MAQRAESSFVGLLRRNPAISIALDDPFLVLLVKGIGVGSLLLVIALLLPLSAGALVPVLYLYGAIPFALLMVHIFRRQRIEGLGSGNISVSNAFRTGGLAAGGLAVAGEVSKSLLPLFLSWYWFGFDVAVSAGLLFCCILGEYVSPFLLGRGGFAGTIMIWSFAILAPIPMLLAISCMLLVLLLTKDTFLMIMTAFWTLPLLLLLLQAGLPLVLLALGYAILFSLRISRERNDFTYGR